MFLRYPAHLPSLICTLYLNLPDLHYSPGELPKKAGVHLAGVLKRTGHTGSNSFAPLYPPTHPTPCPQPLSITLKGITNDSVDPSIDTWRTVALPLLRRAGGLEESNAGGSLELRVVKRGARPAGGGEVQLRVPLVRQLPRVVMRDEGMVKRIRGISYSMKVRRHRHTTSGWGGV
jgi:hypothetical protein